MLTFIQNLLERLYRQPVGLLPLFQSTDLFLQVLFFFQIVSQLVLEDLDVIYRIESLLVQPLVDRGKILLVFTLAQRGCACSLSFPKKICLSPRLTLHID